MEPATKEVLETLIARLEVWALIFGIVLAIGVAGESVYGIRIWWNTRKLHNLEENENAILRLKVREADERSSEARSQAEALRLHVAEANTRAAALEVDALKLRAELAAHGPRANLLGDGNRARLLETLRPFSGQPIAVGRSAWGIEVNGGVVSSTPLGDDTVGLSENLIGILKDAGWRVPAAPLLASWQGYGLNVWVREGASAETQTAAGVLAKALRRVPLFVSGPSTVPDDLAERVGTAVTVPPLTKDTIIVIVLTHP